MYDIYKIQQLLQYLCFNKFPIRMYILNNDKGDNSLQVVYMVTI